MAVYKKHGQAQYTYDFIVRGQRFSGPTGCTTERAAKAFAKTEQTKVKAAIKEAAASGGKPMTVLDATSRFWDETHLNHKNLKNRNEFERNLNWIADQFGEQTLLANIKEADIAKLIAKLRGTVTKRGTVPSNATVNRQLLEPLRGIFIRSRKVWEQPVANIEWKNHFLKEAQERTTEATPMDEATMLEILRGDYLPPLLFALLTGCRRGEIVGLCWRSVNFEAREFTVLGKGDKKRTIPMTDAVYELLLSLRGHNFRSVFTYIAKRASQTNGKCRGDRVRGQRYPITDAGFKTEWRRMKERAEKAGKAIEDFRFHDTRHTAATRLLRATGNLKLVQRLLGHSDIGTTARYAHAAMDDLRQGMEKVKIHTEIHTGPAIRVVK